MNSPTTLPLQSPFRIVESNSIEILDIWYPSVYPNTAEEVHLEDDTNWAVVEVFETDKIDNLIIQELLRNVGDIYTVTPVESYCAENDCQSCDSYDCNIKIVVIKNTTGVLEES